MAAENLNILDTGILEVKAKSMYLSIHLSTNMLSTISLVPIMLMHVSSG